MKLHELEIEKEVLGSIFFEPKSFDIANQILTPECFDTNNRIIYEALQDIYSDGKPIDQIAVYQNLKKKNLLDDVGGLDYLNKLGNYSSSAVNIEYHSKILAEKWMLRRLTKTKSKLENISLTSDPFTILSELSSEIYEIENLVNSEISMNLYDRLPDLMEKVEKKYTGEIESGLMATHFPTLNKATGGIMNTDFVIVYGLEKQGKSFLTERLILDFAFNKIPVGAFTMEMDFDAYSYRALSMEGNIEYLKLRNPRGNGLTEKEFHDFYKRVTKFKDTNILIDDKTFDFERMVSKAKLWKRKYGIKVFVVDYLGLITSHKKFERRDLEVAYYTKTLKNLARELETPIIAVSQANENEKTADSKGALRDGDFALRVSKPIELGIKSITNSFNEAFVFNENHFLVTIERSRYGKNKQNFVCSFVNNNFLEIDIDNKDQYSI